MQASRSSMMQAIFGALVSAAAVMGVPRPLQAEAAPQASGATAETKPTQTGHFDPLGKAPSSCATD